MRVWRIPYSTNVERVALALGHKGIEVEWVDVDPRDRSEVARISGQELVPVLEDDDGRIVADSTAIIRHLEERVPSPPLFPRQPARRAELLVFLEWFDRTWKRPPNAIEGEYRRPAPDEARIERLGRAIQGSLSLFEDLLGGRDFLWGEAFSAADCSAFPFLKYAVLWDEGDDERFHRILRDWLRPDGGYPAVRAWIERVDVRPRA